MSEPITIRLSTPADAADIRELAELDGGHPPHGDVLLAEVDGRPWAAIGMDGAVVADPFKPTAEVVRLLRRQLEGPPRRGRRRGLIRRAASGLVPPRGRTRASSGSA